MLIHLWKIRWILWISKVCSCCLLSLLASPWGAGGAGGGGSNGVKWEIQWRKGELSTRFFINVQVEFYHINMNTITSKREWNVSRCGADTDTHFTVKYKTSFHFTPLIIVFYANSDPLCCFQSCFGPDDEPNMNFRKTQKVIQLFFCFLLLWPMTNDIASRTRAQSTLTLLLPACKIFKNMHEAHTVYTK